MFSAVDTVGIVVVDEGVSVVVDSVSTRIFVNDDGLPRSVIRAGNGCVFIADDVVPVSVQQEIRRQRHLLSEAECIGGQLVKRETGGVFDDHGRPSNVGVFGLDLIANEFTFSNLGTPRCVLVLDVNHAGVKVLQVSKRKHRGVFNEFESQRHLGRRQGHGIGEFQTLVLDEGALSAEPANVHGVKLAVAGRGNLFGLDRDTGFRDVVDLGNVAPTVAGEVSHGPVLVSVIVVVKADVPCETTGAVRRVSLDVHEGTLCTNDVPEVVGDGVVQDGGRRAEHVDSRASKVAAVHLGVARTRVVRDHVVGEVEAGRGWSGNLPSLVLVVVFPDQHGFFARVLNGVVLSNHIRGAVNPQPVPATNGADGVAVQFDDRRANTDT